MQIGVFPFGEPVMPVCQRDRSRKRVFGGQLHSFRADGREMQFLPLAHPRQASRLGSHSSTWAALHGNWVAQTPTLTPR